MNRMEEYSALLQELEETPPRLNFTVARAKGRAKRQKLRRALGLPAAAVAAVCVCFVLLVNVSAPFAAACASIPILKELSEAVSFSPSLSAAVENDWVQPMGLTRSENGAEMTIEYLIVDQKQLNIFYTTGGDAAPMYDVYTDVQGAGGTDISGFGVLYSSARENGELQKITVDFTDGSMPDSCGWCAGCSPWRGRLVRALRLPLYRTHRRKQRSRRASPHSPLTCPSTPNSPRRPRRWS